MPKHFGQVKQHKKTGFSCIHIRFFAGLLFLAAFFVFSRVALSQAAEGALQKNYAEGEAIIKLSDPADASAIAEDYNLDITPISPSGRTDFYLAESASEKSSQKIISDLDSDSRIESAQKNFRYKPLSRTPRDAYFSREWWLFDLESSPGGVSAASAWDLESKSQRKVAVAVIDSGANYKHKDLKKNITKGKAKGKNFERPGKKPTDDDGHGSFLSGIVAGQTNNKRGISGSSFYNNLKVMPLRFDFTTAQAIEALAYAKAKNVMVANASWGAYGSDGYDPALKDAIANFGGVFVAASGNYGLNHDVGNPNYRMYPCDFDLANVICAAASDENGDLAYYSDHGATSVDVAAPGGSDGYPIMGLADSKSRYTDSEGSSLSAAFVSAEAGLLLSKYPNLSTAQVVEIIKNSADAKASLAGRTVSGGKANFRRALDLAASY